MKIDLHTHTISSGHAFSTIEENARVASEKGIELLGISDHGPAMKGSPTTNYFNCIDRVPKIINGVRVLFGIEANIINKKGKLDLPDSILDKLDFVATGFHGGCGYVNRGIKKNTETLIEAMKNPYVKIVVHPYSDKMDVDIEKITLASVEYNVLLEINASSFFLDKIEDEELWDRIKTMVKILKDNNRKMIIGSDAHHSSEVGKFDEVIEKFEELGITEDDVLNNDVEGVLEFLGVEK